MAWHSGLRLLHARLASHFARPQPFARALRFVQGILSTVERKNGWQLAEQAREATPYGMQRLLSQAVWDADGVRDELRAFVLQQLGSSPLTVAIDESGFLIMYNPARFSQEEQRNRARSIHNASYLVILRIIDNIQTRPAFGWRRQAALRSHRRCAQLPGGRLPC